METKVRITTPEIPPSPDLGAIATEVNGLLDKVEALIPDYAAPDPQRVRKVAVNARFAHELIPPTITAVTNYEPLRRHSLFDVDNGLQALAARDQLRPLMLRMEAIASALQFTIDNKLAHAAVETLQTYEWSKRHAATPEGVALRPYVAEMRRVVTKTINRRQQKPPSPPATPAPQSPPADETPQGNA